VISLPLNGLRQFASAVNGMPPHPSTSLTRNLIMSSDGPFGNDYWANTNLKMIVQHEYNRRFSFSDDQLSTAPLVADLAIDAYVAYCLITPLQQNELMNDSEIEIASNDEQTTGLDAPGENLNSPSATQIKLSQPQIGPCALKVGRNQR